jgi:hypothetical protein
MAEFVANNHDSEKTGCSPFFANYGIHLQMIFSQHPVQNRNDISGVNENIISQKMNAIFERMKAEMNQVQ